MFYTLQSGPPFLITKNKKSLIMSYLYTWRSFGGQGDLENINIEFVVWRPKYFVQISKTSDSDSQQSGPAEKKLEKMVKIWNSKKSSKIRVTKNFNIWFLQSVCQNNHQKSELMLKLSPVLICLVLFFVTVVVASVW